MSIFTCKEVYIISLKKNISDFNHILKFFPYAQIFRAIDMRNANISTLDLTLRAKLSILHGQDSSEDVCSKGAVGCSLSHYMCWKKLLLTNKPYCVIFEEDVVFRKNKMKNLQQYINSSEKMGANYVSFGSEFNSLGTELLYKKYDQNANRVYMFLGSYAQKVTRQGALTLVKNFFPIDMQVDGYISTLCRFGYLIASAPRKKIAKVRFSLKTTVQRKTLPSIKTLVPRCNTFYTSVFFVFISLTVLLALTCYKIKKLSRTLSTNK
jgi:GR25 family glycosyltransferase involved in LPS biosynthesis